jgi:NADPH:quinone reductase-like Zn-dependent oxidoreductase
MLAYREDIPVPTPGPRDVLIRVAAAGVNNTDINTRLAWYSKHDGDSNDASWSGQPLQFPRIQGADVCGHIVAVGVDLSTDRVGERVLIEPCIRESAGKALDQPWYFGSECDGGFAEYTTVAGRHAYPIDSDLSDVELASFPCSYSTAENLLTRAQVSRGERVLVTGASGGVGSAAVQLGKARGAEIVAVTSPEKEPKLRDLGADDVVPRGGELLHTIENSSVDVVIDLVAGPQWPQYLDVLRPGGRYAVSGAIGGPIVELDVRTLYLKDLSLLGCTVLAPDVFANLVSLIEQEKISPVVAQSFRLDDIAKAQAVFQEKRHVGKVVLDVNSG